MLSIQQCRELLEPEISMDDEAIKSLRDQIYCLAALAIDAALAPALADDAPNVEPSRGRVN